MIPAREPAKVVLDILKAEMELADGAIMMAYEKWDIPANKGLFVSISYMGPGKIVANVNEFDSATNEEVQQITMVNTVQIDVMSFDSSARLRKEEVAMALASIYSKQLQEKYNMQIGRQPTAFADASNLEVTKMLNRFVTTVSVTSLHVKRKSVDYFDKFNQRPPYLEQINPPAISVNE